METSDRPLAVVTGASSGIGRATANVGPVPRILAVARDDVPPTEGNVYRFRPEGNAVRGRWRGV